MHRWGDRGRGDARRIDRRELAVHGYVFLLLLCLSVCVGLSRSLFSSSKVKQSRAKQIKPFTAAATSSSRTHTRTPLPFPNPEQQHANRHHLCLVGRHPPCHGRRHRPPVCAGGVRPLRRRAGITKNRTAPRPAGGGGKGERGSGGWFSHHGAIFIWKGWRRRFDFGEKGKTGFCL